MHSLCCWHHNIHRNRLYGDIVESLQFLKCAIPQDLLFWESPPSSISEAEIEDDDGDEAWVNEDIILDEESDYYLYDCIVQCIPIFWQTGHGINPSQA